MKVSVLGCGDITKISRHSNLSQEDVNKLIEDAAKLLARKRAEIVIIPDRGIPTEIAKIYKANNGRKVIGMVPVNDTKYGIEHIKKYLPLLDERIEVNDWYDATSDLAAEGDICMVIGMSPGIMYEVSILKYHYRYLNCKTKVVWFRDTISQPVQKEIEEEVPIKYINSVEELEEFLQ